MCHAAEAEGEATVLTDLYGLRPGAIPGDLGGALKDLGLFEAVLWTGGLSRCRSLGDLGLFEAVSLPAMLVQ